ncbi:acyl-CoA thioesterase [Dasania marina]|uniref:acyl-CoA thioesterase n=1 Tax=Dasania marina TaxID=471499 RepID=UPI00035CECB4|nr:thioesterase family protein [Dasania marina]
MARVSIDMPEHYSYSTELPIRISDTNGGHLSNYAVLALIHEARLHFLAQYGYNEEHIILTDSAIVYKAEGFYGDILCFDMAAGDFNKYGCDIFYRVRNKKTGADIAHAKTGMVYYDYQQQKVSTLPDEWRAALNPDSL